MRQAHVGGLRPWTECAEQKSTTRICGRGRLETEGRVRWQRPDGKLVLQWWRVALVDERQDFDKSTTDPADFIDTHDKELLICENCGSPITAQDHVRWMCDKLGELAYANQTLTVASHGKLGAVRDVAPRDGRPLERSDFIRALCPNCRSSYILSDEWGES